MLNTVKTLNFCAMRSDSDYDDRYRLRNHNGDVGDQNIVDTVHKKLPQNSDVIDIGAGDGRNTMLFAKKGHDVLAVELSEQGRSVIDMEARMRGVGAKVETSGHNVCKAPFAEKADAVFMSRVTMHYKLDELKGMFENVSNSIKKGGLFVFDALIDKTKKNTVVDEQNGSCKFDEKSLKKLAKDTGFKLEKITDYKENRPSMASYMLGKSWGLRGDSTKLKWFILRK